LNGGEDLPTPCQQARTKTRHIVLRLDFFLQCGAVIQTSFQIGGEFASMRKTT
jgi:hypothetical protein